MLLISNFYGIIIKMYFRESEHNKPNIYAIYNEYVGIIDLNTFEILEGDLPNKALKMVQEWTKINQIELMRIWNTQEFKKLPPLV